MGGLRSSPQMKQAPSPPYASVLLLIALTLPLSALPIAQAQCEQRALIGNDIWIYGKDSIRVTAWRQPLDVDWEAWKACFKDRADDYYQGLTSRIFSMFGLSRAMLVSYGLDEAKQRVYVTLQFSVSDSSNYDAELDSLTFYDIFKQAYRGYLDEVHVYFGIPFYDVSPTPTSRGASEVHWINPSFDEAPLAYTIYFSRVATITVSVAGLPSNAGTKVFVNNAYKGVARANSPLEIRLKEGTYTISVEQELPVASGVKYVTSRSSVTVTGASSITFSYTKMVKVVLNDTVTIDGIPHPPGEHWITAGQHTLSAERGERYVSSVERVAYIADSWEVGGARYAGKTVTANIDSDRDPVTIRVSFKEVREYYVTIKGGSSDVSGWYPFGSRIEASAESVRYVGNGTRYVFLGWYEAGNLYSASTRLLMQVDRAYSLEAKWRKEHLVTVESAYGKVEGAGWYPEGAEATLRIVETAVQVDSDRLALFEGWKGGISSSGPSVTFKVGAPTRIVAIWARAYRVIVNPGLDVEYNVYGCAAYYGGYCWAKEGSHIQVVFSETRKGFPVADVLTGFSVQGLSYYRQDPSKGYVEGTVTGPVYVEAHWGKDYTPLYILLAAFAVVIGALLAFTKLGMLKLPVKIESKPSLESELELKKEETRVRPLEEILKEKIEALEKNKKELEKYINYLSRLEEAYSKGEVSETAYQMLSNEYMSNINKLKKDIEMLEKELKEIEGKIGLEREQD